MWDPDVFRGNTIQPRTSTKSSRVCFFFCEYFSLSHGRQRKGVTFSHLNDERIVLCHSSEPRPRIHVNLTEDHVPPPAKRKEDDGVRKLSRRLNGTCLGTPVAWQTPKNTPTVAGVVHAVGLMSPTPLSHRRTRGRAARPRWVARTSVATWWPQTTARVFATASPPITD